MIAPNSMSTQPDDTRQPVELHADQFGTPGNPDLVVLHGLFGSATNWRSVIRELESDFRITAVDLRNHGNSPWHSNASYPAMAEDTVVLIERLALKNPSILGHSMGGKTAMCLVQSGIVSVDRLIVVDIAPVAYDHSHLGYIDAMQAIDLDQVASRSEVDARLADDIPESGIRQFLLQNLVRDDDRYRWRINLAAIRNNMPALLGYPALPVSEVDTLFLRGANSDYIHAGLNSEIERQFPRSRIDTIADAGHWLHAEQPGRVIAATRQFLTT